MLGAFMLSLTYTAMSVDVYVDVLFLINAGMDCLCLSLAARLLHHPMSLWRLLVGGAIGGFYAVAVLFMPSGGWTLIPDLAICLLMCLVVFGRKRLLLSGVVFFVLSMALGGIMTGLYSFINRTLYDAGLLDLPLDDGGPEGWLLWILAAAGGGISTIGTRYFRKSAARRSCRIMAEIAGQTIELEGMVDTGNLLTDPLSGKSVICVDDARFRLHLPPAVQAILPPVGAIPDAESLTSSPLGGRLRLIPTATVAGRTLLVGLVPDRLTLRTEKSRSLTRNPSVKSSATETTVDAVLALTTHIQGSEALVPAILLS